MEKFLEFAKKQYEDSSNINWTYFDDEEERIEEVVQYIGQSMEAILLFKKFIEEGKN